MSSYTFLMLSGLGLGALVFAYIAIRMSIEAWLDGSHPGK
jgi:hypothetical protein